MFMKGHSSENIFSFMLCFSVVLSVTPVTKSHSSLMAFVAVSLMHYVAVDSREFLTSVFYFINFQKLVCKSFLWEQLSVVDSSNGITP